MERKHIINLFQRIEQGEILLTLLGKDPQEQYTGQISYQTTTGLRIMIHIDCNEWDYVDSIWQGEKCLVHFDQLWKLSLEDDFQPSEAIAWQRYGIPGYMKCRCILCGRVFGKLDAIEKYGFHCPPGMQHQTPSLPNLCERAKR